MKQLIIITNTLTALVFLSACGSNTPQAPSQNNALNSISKSNASKEKKGLMQESLDNWLKNDWIPTVSKDETIQKKYMQEEKTDVKQSHISDVKKSQTIDKKQKKSYKEKEDKPFTIQEYVDKAEAYMKAKPNNYESSNVHKLESMPVIGKQD